MSKLDVQVMVDLPGPSFRGLRHDGLLYVRLFDVVRFLDKTAQAFDAAHANGDIGKSFRACIASIEDATVDSRATQPEAVQTIKETGSS